MKFLLDENVPHELRQVLQKKGHECVTLSELKSVGISNGEVVRVAHEQQAIIITCDDDFIHLNKERQSITRVIFIHIYPSDPRTILKLVEHHLSFCIYKLRQPGKVIITETDCSYKRSLEH